MQLIAQNFNFFFADFRVNLRQPWSRILIEFIVTQFSKIGCFYTHQLCYYVTGFLLESPFCPIIKIINSALIQKNTMTIRILLNPDVNAHEFVQLDVKINFQIQYKLNTSLRVLNFNTTIAGSASRRYFFPSFSQYFRYNCE